MASSVMPEKSGFPFSVNPLSRPFVGISFLFKNSSSSNAKRSALSRISINVLESGFGSPNALKSPLASTSAALFPKELVFPVMRAVDFDPCVAVDDSSFDVTLFVFISLFVVVAFRSLPFCCHVYNQLKHNSENLILLLLLLDQCEKPCVIANQMGKLIEQLVGSLAKKNSRRKAITVTILPYRKLR